MNGIYRKATLFVFMLTCTTACLPQDSPGSSQELSFRHDSISTVDAGLRIHIPLVSKLGQSLGLRLQPILFKQVDFGPPLSNYWAVSGLDFVVDDPIPTPTYNSVPPQICKATGQVVTIFNNWAVVDGHGTVHKLPLSFSVDGCSNPSQTGTTVDGSGYTVIATASGVSVTWTLYDGSGNKTTAVFSTGGFPSTTTYTVTDPNGNTFIRTFTVNSDSSTTTTWVDKTGVTMLTKTTANTPGSAATYRYTDATGHTQYYSVSYTKYTWETNFNCSGVTESSRTNTWLPTSVNLPDGSFYSFTYETTPGYSSTFKTGRIGSMTLPTGGVIAYTYSGGSNGVSCSDQTTAILTRHTSDGNFVFTHTSFSTTVTDPNTNDSVYKFAYGTITGGGAAPNNLIQEQHFIGNQSNNQVAASKPFVTTGCHCRIVSALAR